MELNAVNTGRSINYWMAATPVWHLLIASLNISWKQWITNKFLLGSILPVFQG